MNIFIAGSASEKINPKYLEGLDEISKFLLEQNLGILCVGTSTGSVGKVYNYFKENNGEIHLIIPEVYEKESLGLVANSKQLVYSLYELQQIAIHDTQATIVLPGGNGTLGELYMLTDNIKAKMHNSPIIIYNCNGFYDKIKEMNDFMVEAGTMQKFQYDFFKFCNTPEDVINAIKKYLL